MKKRGRRDMTDFDIEYWKAPPCPDDKTKMYMHIKALPAGAIYYECTHCGKFYAWTDRDDGTTYDDNNNWRIEEVQNPRPYWPKASELKI